jgi:hypothetical protein
LDSFIARGTILLFPESPQAPEGVTDYRGQRRIFDQLGQPGASLTYSLVIEVRIELPESAGHGARLHGGCQVQYCGADGITIPQMFAPLVKC